MTTADTHWLIDSTRLAASSDLKDRFQTPLRQADRDRMSKVYPDDGVFTTKLGFVALTDAFGISGTSEATDGVGEVLDLAAATDDGSNVPFENLIATDYYVALTLAEHPQGIQINPRSGDPEYIETLEDVGDKGDPDSVVDNGADLTFNINSLCESGVDFSGRTAVVYMKVPAEGATTEAIAIESLTVAYSAPNNTITTTGLLGQASPASTTAADYEVVVLGPTVRKNTDLRTVDGIVFLGIVTGGGAGNPPTAFDTTDQNLIDVTLSGFNAALDAFIQDKVIETSRAGTKSPITTPRHRLTACLYSNGLIYAFGGVESGPTDSNKNEAYDSSSDAWLSKAVIPVQSKGGAAIGPRYDARAVTLGDTIYLMGGRDAGGTRYELVQRYKPGTDTWDTPAADLLGIRSGGAVGVINGKIYYAGGNSAVATSHQDTYEYDSGLDSWTAVASVTPSGMGQYSAFAVVKDKLYVFNSDTAGSLVDMAWVYDPAFDIWAAITDFPDARDSTTTGFVIGHTAAVVNDVIHILGGEDGAFEPFDHHVMYNVDEDAYVVLGHSDVPVHAYSAFVADADGVIYHFGGLFGNDGVIDTHTSGFDARNIYLATSHGIASTTGEIAARDISSIWLISHLPEGDPFDTLDAQISGVKATVFEGNIYLCGGSTIGSGVTDSLQVYHPETNTWSRLADMLTARENHGFVTHQDNRKLYAVEGWNATELNDIEVYDVDANSWLPAATGLATPKQEFACAMARHEIFITGGRIGGANQTSNITFDLVLNTTTLRTVLPASRMGMPMVPVRQRSPDGGEPGVGWWLYLFGGNVAAGSDDDVLKFDTLTNSWATASNILLNDRERHWAGLVESVENDQRYIVIAGGQENGVGTVLDSEVFDPDDGTVVSLGNINKAGGRNWNPAGAVVGGRVYLIGGADFGLATDYDDTEILTKYADPIIVKIENYSASRHTTQGTRRIPAARDTIGYKASQIWGFGTWDGEVYNADIIRVGED